MKDQQTDSQPRFGVALSSRVWNVIEIATGRRVPDAGYFRKSQAVAHALQLDAADALRRCTGARAVTVTDGGVRVTARSCPARTDGGSCSPFHTNGSTCEYCEAVLA
jgi:hypothetical protein